MIQLTQSRFRAIGNHTIPIGVPHCTGEKAWFQADNSSALGIVLLDMIDGDWSFVALAKDSLGHHRCFDSGVSFSTMAEAVVALERAFTGADVVNQGDDAEWAAYLDTLPRAAFGAG